MIAARSAAANFAASTNCTGSGSAMVNGASVPISTLSAPACSQTKRKVATS